MNRTDNTLSRCETFRNFDLRHSAYHECSDLSNIVSGESSARVSFASLFGRLLTEHLISMQSVFTMRHVFEILQHVVRFVSVFVIDFMASRTWTKKSEHDYAMDIARLFALVVSTQSNNVVSAGMGSWFTNVSSTSIPNLCEIANFVQAEWFGQGFPHALMVSHRSFYTTVLYLG